jgi:hypothetical protein
MSERTNMTPAEELALVKKTFVAALLDALNDDPSPAMMAVAQRYIASERDAQPLTVPATPSAPTPAPAEAKRLPFPVKPQATQQDVANSIPFAGEDF